MTVYTKNNAVGIDKIINRMQAHLQRELNDWNIDIYHKLYNVDNKPVAFISDIDYRDVLLNDNQNVCAFLVKESESKSEQDLMKIDVDIIFTLNLSGTQREDETAKIIAYQAVKSSHWKVTGIERTLPVILSGFDLNGLEYRDMQPFFNFAIKCEVYYSLNECVKN